MCELLRTLHELSGHGSCGKKTTNIVRNSKDDDGTCVNILSGSEHYANDFDNTSYVNVTKLALIVTVGLFTKRVVKFKMEKIGGKGLFTGTSKMLY